MTNQAKVFFGAFATFALLVIVVFFVVNKSGNETTTPKLLGGYGGCSQCLGNNCYQAPCNMDCNTSGDRCETVVMGGAQFEFNLDTKTQDGDYAQFNMGNSNSSAAIVERNNAAMKDAGIAIGDKVLSVNGESAKTDLEFAKLVLKLPKGTKLTVQKASGEKADKTL